MNSPSLSHSTLLRGLIFLLLLLIFSGFNQVHPADAIFHKNNQPSDSLKKNGHHTGVKVVVFFVDNLSLADLGDRDFPQLYKAAQQGGLGLVHRRLRKGLFSGGSFLDEVYEDTIKESRARSLHVGYLRVPNPDEGSDVSVLSNDITFFDFRIPPSIGYVSSSMTDENRQLIEADHLLAVLTKHYPLKRCAFLILSAKPSVTLRTQGNRALHSMILLTDVSHPGILASDTTRRKGLVSSLDIIPTIFSPFNTKADRQQRSDNFIRIAPDKNNIITIRKNLEQYLTLKYLRYVSHGILTTFLVGALLLFFLPLWQRNSLHHPRAARFLGISAIVFPACIFLISILLPAGRWPPAIVIMGLVAVLIAYPLSRNIKRTLDVLGWISMITSTYLITGQLFRSNLLLWNPLGFADVFAGGRFYGMNNDCMGIMLGSTVFALFFVFDRWLRVRWLQISLAIFIFALAVLSQTPFFGANVGGTVTAMVTGSLAVIGTISERLIRKKRVMIIVGLVLLAELFIAYLDYRFGIAQTHAGKAMGELLHHSAGNPILGIVQSKLFLFSAMLLTPPWNILFASQAIIYWTLRKRIGSGIGRCSEPYPYLTRIFPILFYSSLVAFLFNDTGIISGGIILIYLTVPLGILFSEQQSAPLFQPLTHRQELPLVSRMSNKTIPKS